MDQQTWECAEAGMGQQTWECAVADLHKAVAAEVVVARRSGGAKVAAVAEERARPQRARRRVGREHVRQARRAAHGLTHSTIVRKGFIYNKKNGAGLDLRFVQTNILV